MSGLYECSLSSTEGTHSQSLPSIPISIGLTSADAFELLRIHGRNELEDKKTPKWLILLQQLWAPMPIMIWIAAIVEVAIGNYPDFGILIAIQFINASLGFYEVVKVRLLFKQTTSFKAIADAHCAFFIGRRCCCSSEEFPKTISHCKTRRQMVEH